MKNIFSSVFNKSINSKIELPKINKPLLRPLEPRILLDAAAVETSFDLSEKAILEQQAADYLDNAASHDVLDTAAGTLLDGGVIAPPLERDRRNEIVFIDNSVKNKGQIIASLDPSAQMVIVDNKSDGVEQIATALEGVSDIFAIHIISHGDSGSLNLGSGKLNQESISGQHADELAIIRDVLTESGDILIYGCNFGQGEEGQEAARALSLATGADIAASDDLTGAESGGGDWDLELHAGEVETQSLEARGFEGVLAGISQDAPETEIGVKNTSVVFSNANGNAPSLASNIGTTATVTLTSTNGTLSLSSTNGLSFTAGDGADDTSLTFNGLITNINAALDGLTFKPNADFAGDAEIQMDSVAGVENIHLATNHGFEKPDTPAGSIRFIDDTDVPGWSTTDVQGKIEIWNEAGEVSAFEGDQFIEINAFSTGILSQTVSLGAGEPLEFNFAHRGRDGVDTVHAKLIDLGADGMLGTADDVVLLDKNYSTGNTAWRQYSEDLGTASGNDILIEMTAVSSASSSTAAGNFLDAVNLRVTDPGTTASSKIVIAIQVDTDGDGISNIDDIDDDNDGILDINEQIEFANGGRLTAGQRVETFGPHSQTAPSSIEQNFTGVEVNIDNENISETQTYNFELPLSNVSFGVRSLDFRASYGDFTVTYADGTVDNNVAFTIKDPADYTAEELAFAVDTSTNTGGALELEVDANGNNVVSTSSGINQDSGILLFNTDPTRLVTSISLTNLSDPSIAVNSSTRVNIFGSPTFVNRDQDGVADSVDLDSDNDGISDAHESGFVVAEQARLQAIIDDNAASAADKITAADRLAKLSEIFADGTITEQESSDYLSIGEDAVVSGDADNDGLMDIFDANPNDSDRTESVGTTPIDNDGDGVANFIDLDSDGDGIADAIEARTTAGFIANDGTDASNADADGDGVLDIFDTNSTFGGTDGNFNAPVDTDKDGAADYLDLDSDNDTITDSNEGLQSPETLTYENPDGSASSSNGLANVLENEHGNTDELAYREIGVVAANDTATTNEDTTLTVNEQNGLLANDESTAELAITSFSVGTQTVKAGEWTAETDGRLETAEDVINLVKETWEVIEDIPLIDTIIDQTLVDPVTNKIFVTKFIANKTIKAGEWTAETGVKLTEKAKQGLIVGAEKAADIITIINNSVDRLQSTASSIHGSEFSTALNNAFITALDTDIPKGIISNDTPTSETIPLSNMRRYAELASETYSTNEEDGTTITGNENEELYRITYQNFVGEARYDKTTKEIVIAFRGSDGVISDPYDWLDNYTQNVSGAENTVSYNQASGFINGDLYQLIEKWKNHYGDPKVTVVGHSLGGGLAQYATQVAQNFHIDQVVTFNSAGLGQNTLEKLNLKTDVKTTHVQTLGDYVSRIAGEHIPGNSVMVNIGISDEVTMKMRSLYKYGALVTWIKDQHSIVSLIEALDEDIKEPIVYEANRKLTSGKGSTFGEPTLSPYELK